MAEIVYFLCAITSLACAIFLFRGYRQSGSRFPHLVLPVLYGLAINNFLLFTDLVLLPDTVDLSIVRIIPAFLGIGLLVYGLIWDAS